MMDPMSRPDGLPTDAEVEESFRNRYAMLFPHLADDQIRLVLGADANSLTDQGRDGTSIVARAAGIDPKIVTTGIAELAAAQLQLINGQALSQVLLALGWAALKERA